MIESSDTDLFDIDRIDIVFGGDYGQGSYRFPMKLLYIMNNEKRYESIQPVGYILNKKDNGIILKNKIIKEFSDSIKLLYESMSFNSQQIS